MHTNENKTGEAPDLEASILATLAAHPGLTREALLKHLEREDTTKEAARATFPGPLREAFASQPRQIFGYTLQPVTLALLSVLEEIQSPFIPMVEIIASMQGKPGKEIARAIEKKLHPKIKDLVAAAWCFVTPIETIESRLVLGSAHLRKQALAEISGKVRPAELSQLNDAVMLHYVESFSTAVEYRAKKPEGDQSFPSAPAAPKTASAGALTSAER